MNKSSLGKLHGDGISVGRRRVEAWGKAESTGPLVMAVTPDLNLIGSASVLIGSCYSSW
jgi:hypothetical protein